MSIIKRVARTLSACAQTVTHPFPFPTSLSEHADASSIRSGGRSDFVWNAFRRLVWADRDLALLGRQLARAPADAVDDETQIAAQILALQLSPQFRMH